MNLYRKLSGFRTSLVRTKSKTSSQDFSAEMAAIEDEKVDQIEQSSGMEDVPSAGLTSAAAVDDPTESGNDGQAESVAATQGGTQEDASQDDGNAQPESNEVLEIPKKATEESSTQNISTSSAIESPGAVGPETMEVSNEGIEESSTQDSSTNPEKEAPEGSAVIESPPSIVGETQEAAPKTQDEVESSLDSLSVDPSIASELDHVTTDGSHKNVEAGGGGKSDMFEIHSKEGEFGNSVLETAGAPSSVTSKEAESAEPKSHESAEQVESVAHMNHESHEALKVQSDSKAPPEAKHGGGGFMIFMVLFSFSAIVGLAVARK